MLLSSPPLYFKAGGDVKKYKGAARGPRAGRAGGYPQRLAKGSIVFKCSDHLYSRERAKPPPSHSASHSQLH